MKSIKTKFNFSNVDDFDNHIKLSIPNFFTLDSIFSSITYEYAQPESIVLDLGCSTGRFLHNLTKLQDTEYVGCDLVNFKNRRQSFTYHQLDVEESLKKYLNKNVSCLICMFTLQFLGKSKRQRVLELLNNYIEQGTVLLISEKVFLDNTRLQTLIHRMHIQEKRLHFTDKQILDKDNQLSVSMYCKTEKELEIELQYLGNFTKVWQSYNFMGYTVYK
tara:strand:+ start:3000 stop:3653 length:654 start_codon:yes stop_codon:yes gene_type:complete